MEINEETLKEADEFANRARYVADIIEKHLEEQKIPFTVIGSAAAILMCSNAAKKKMPLDNFLNLCALTAEMYLQEYVKKEEDV